MRFLLCPLFDGEGLQTFRSECGQIYDIEQRYTIAGKDKYSYSRRHSKKMDVLESLSHTFVYVGTIAAWFDFDSLLLMLSENPDANVVLIGPNEVEIPVHERIHYLGTVDRQYIFSFLDAADCLIMPFVVNELIRSVNPVKLYEYIYANKPVLAPAYEETYQFEPYIYLYSTAKEFAVCALL